jgi:hypothetical protein
MAPLVANPSKSPKELSNCPADLMHADQFDATIERRLQPELEIELRFLVPGDVALEARKNLEPVVIEQHILARSQVHKLIERFGVDREVDNPAVFTSARARRIVTLSDELFLVEFKSKKWSYVSRFEHSVVIDQSTFKKLSLKHSCGSLLKLRYTRHACVHTPDGAGRAIVTLDEYLAAGNPREYYLKEPIFSADVELSDISLVPYLRAGRPPFPWLSRCLELSSADPSIRKPLSNRSLAKNGLGPEQRWSIAQLMARGS